jgi:hypothetical protein
MPTWTIRFGERVRMRPLKTWAMSISHGRKAIRLAGGPVGSGQGLHLPVSVHLYNLSDTFGS